MIKPPRAATVRFLLTSLLSLSALAVVTGCGDDDPDKATQAPSATRSAPATPTQDPRIEQAAYLQSINTVLNDFNQTFQRLSQLIQQTAFGNAQWEAEMRTVSADLHTYNQQVMRINPPAGWDDVHEAELAAYAELDAVAFQIERSLDTDSAEELNGAAPRISIAQSHFERSSALTDAKLSGTPSE